MVKVTTVLFEATPAKTYFPSAEAASEISPKPAVAPAEYGELATGVNVPTVGSIVKTLMSWLPPFDAIRNLPPATTMRFTAYPPPPAPAPPVLNGEPGMGVRPFVPAVKPDTVFVA